MSAQPEHPAHRVAVLPPGGSSPRTLHAAAARPSLTDASERPGATTPNPSDPSPLDRASLRTRVNAALGEFLRRQERRLEDVTPDLLPLADAASALLRGGKRLRPAFCYWGWRGADGADCQEIVTAAASLELFQAAALVHDDVMDGSDTRRGQPAVHRRLGAMHRGSGYAGSPERFGEAGAILLGDLFLCWCDEMLTGSGLPAPALAAGRPVFDLMRTQLMAGQYLDILEQARADPASDSVERARRVIRFKSAKYTIEHPLLLGGRLAGASPELLAAYSAYGLPLGEAFQLRDDVLGVFGDPAETGKPAGDDLREGKRTVLVTMALTTASAQHEAVLRRGLGDPELDADGVAELQAILAGTGALARVESLIDELAGRAHRALRTMPAAPEARAALAELIPATTSRAA